MVDSWSYWVREMHYNKTKRSLNSIEILSDVKSPPNNFMQQIRNKNIRFQCHLDCDSITDLLQQLSLLQYGGYST